MPIFPLVIFYLIAEVYVLNRVWNSYGFMNTAFALFAMIVLGTGIIRNQGRYMLTKVQEAAARGETPSDQLLHGMMIFLGGLLFIAPGFVSDVMGLVLVLPGLRHLTVPWFKRRMAKKMSTGQFRVFTFGSSSGSSSGRFSSDFEGTQSMREVTPLSLDGKEGEVIDVTPIKRDSQD
jgi:UPF0716 protein FxsA